ncbi:MAG TPA: sterol desaturase family protein [Polyangiales bacterium]|nr:sterol desaturase family protein [Polyangiales bacterium]
MRLSWVAIPFFLAAMVCERLLRSRRGQPVRDVRDYWTSIALGLGSSASRALYGGALLALMYWGYAHRFFTIETSFASWIAALLARDFTYYWAHRMDHEHRFMWAAHVTHHSSQELHLATAVRQSWTQPLVNRWFELPLVLAGFHPLLIASVAGVSSLYQFFLHTELVGKLGPLEWVLNTPSHHRVHHASNTQYLDRNHGGIFIVWDRLFGTFAEERADEPLVYGLTKNVHGYNWLYLTFHEWLALGREVARATTWRERVGLIVHAPGWSIDGSTLTAAQMRDGRPSAAPQEPRHGAIV